VSIPPALTLSKQKLQNSYLQVHSLPPKLPHIGSELTPTWTTLSMKMKSSQHTKSPAKSCALLMLPFADAEPTL
jgi:hypothetical protein